MMLIQSVFQNTAQLVMTALVLMYVTGKLTLKFYRMNAKFRNFNHTTGFDISSIKCSTSKGKLKLQPNSK